MTLLYDWERSVRDKDGDKVVIGLRDLNLYLDVQQENRLVIFTPAETAEFAAIVGEAVSEVARRAQAGLPGESVG